jgi:uncharacterized cupin superfamily protein
MTPPHRIIHLDPHGPGGPGGAGLAPLDLDPDDFQSPLPVQHVHVYFADDAAGLSVGVWDTTTMQEAFGPYPGDEFIVVIEGAFAMVDGKGGAVTAGAGDSVCFRNGIPTSWKQDGYLRKIYLTWRDPLAETPQIASAEGGVIVLDRPPEGDGTVVFRNDTGNMLVRHVAPGAHRVPMAVAAAHELVQVLTGTVEVAEPGGAAQSFGAGQVFFIPQGTTCAWDAGAGFSAYRVSLHLAAPAEG